MGMHAPAAKPQLAKLTMSVISDAQLDTQRQLFLSHRHAPRPLPTLLVQPTPVQMPNMRVTRRDFCDCQSTLCPDSTPCSSRPSNCPHNNASSHTPEGCKCVPTVVDWVPDAPASCHTHFRPAAAATWWLPVCLSAALCVSRVVQHDSCASLRCTYSTECMCTCDISPGNSTTIINTIITAGGPRIESDHSPEI